MFSWLTESLERSELEEAGPIAEFLRAKKDTIDYICCGPERNFVHKCTVVIA